MHSSMQMHIAIEVSKYSAMAQPSPAEEPEVQSIIFVWRLWTQWDFLIFYMSNNMNSVRIGDLFLASVKVIIDCDLFS